MISIFILSSLEGWPDILSLCIDSNTKDIVNKPFFFFLNKKNNFFF
jgi:hypothetical protein